MCLQELKEKDEKYVKDLARQAEDVSQLTNRMDEQVKDLMKSLRQELIQVEVGIFYCAIIGGFFVIY